MTDAGRFAISLIFCCVFLVLALINSDYANSENKIAKGFY